MFLGHFALGFSAKRMEPKPSLGTFFFAVQFLDLLWPFLLVTGVEKVEVQVGNTAFTPLNFVSYPYSHSLLAALAWSVLFGIVYFLLKKQRSAAVLLGFLVLSHWLLDFLTHQPDLQLTPWMEARYGLGLWNNRMATMMLEVLIFAIGIYLYISVTDATNKVGKYSLWAFIAFMLLVYFANAFGPPPSSAKDLGIVGFSQWILIAWGYWIDRNRRVLPENERRVLVHQIE